LLLSYDGSAYLGWQVQQQGPTIQGRLEEAFRIVTRHSVAVHGSGRTDAGVHAFNQVANARVPAGLDLDKLQASLNGLVGPSIAVKRVIPVSPTFHARHRARGKCYHYYIHNRPYPPVFALHRCWWLRHALDVDAMRAAAPHLVGTHDFSAFRAAGCEAPSPVRTLTRLEVREGDWVEGTLRIELEAKGFLQHMARIIAGTLVAVGQGKLQPDDLPGILASRERENAHATAPARGLHLVRVRYDLAEFPELAALEQG
jgi:tRNA pseudouridine38-40 synthase